MTGIPGTSAEGPLPVAEIVTVDYAGNNEPHDYKIERVTIPRKALDAAREVLSLSVAYDAKNAGGDPAAEELLGTVEYAIEMNKMDKKNEITERYVELDRVTHGDRVAAAAIALRKAVQRNPGMLKLNDAEDLRGRLIPLVSR